jgi:hypothetical protein
MVLLCCQIPEKNNILESSSNNLPPNYDMGRLRAEHAHNILIKMKELGLPESFDDSLASLCTDVADLISALNKVTLISEKITAKNTDQWESVAECLADMLAEIEHIDWHTSSIKNPLKEIAEYSYNFLSD